MSQSGSRPSVRAVPVHPGIARANPGPPTLQQELDRIHDELGKMLEDAQASGGDPCQVRAGRLYTAAHEASGMSGRAFAERIERDDRMHRFYRVGAPASVPLECVMRMPKRARLAMLKAWAELERASADDAEDSQRGAA